MLAHPRLKRCVCVSEVCVRVCEVCVLTHPRLEECVCVWEVCVRVRGMRADSPSAHVARYFPLGLKSRPVMVAL